MIDMFSDTYTESCEMFEALIREAEERDKIRRANERLNKRLYDRETKDSKRPKDSTKC